MNERLIKRTTSVCSMCLTKVPAAVWQVGTQVVMRKHCAAHGDEQALLASDSRHYFEPGGGAGPGASGGGCGPGGCAALNASCTLMFEITERCNLTCPTCFAISSPKETWQMPLAEFESKLERLLGQGGKSGTDIVQLSGGEPTIHPELDAMVAACFDRGVKEVFINTNGVELGRSPELARRLSPWADRLRFYLQLDGFRAQTHATIRGAKGLGELKAKAIANAHEYGLFVLPVMTVTRGVNLDELGDVIRFVADRPEAMNSVMLQPAMYAGRYLGEQLPNRITMSEVAAEVERQTDGLFTRDDFGPIPCSNPNCFAMAVALRVEGKIVPISRYFPPYETWSRPDVAERLSSIADMLPQNMFDRLPDDELVDQLLDLLTADDDDAVLSDRSRFFVVSIKPFMDATNYDQDRVDACCVHVIDRAGHPVSLCEYNTLRRPRGLL